ncbi:MAG: TlpA family protein disulfide reductase, partial [Acidiferrobacterales bacterium]|nr:TlpA family protein disulfide reductase [Acidiferrobacterales bacterium]
NFWATWCPPCVHELPSIQALKDHFSDQSFEVLALNMGERGKDIENFLKAFETKLDFPILLNADLNVAKNWNVRAMPTSLFIDKNGDIAETYVGPRDWNSEIVQQQVASLLGE